VPHRIRPRFIVQRSGVAEPIEVPLTKVELLDRQLGEVISQRESLAMEASALKRKLEALEPEIRRMRVELQRAQEEIERLNAGANPQISVDSATADAILALISERHDPSLQRIASCFGLSQEEARSILGELQRSGLVSPLNLQNGVQRWIVLKKGMQHLEHRGLLNQTFRQRAPSRIYW
jgi:hypothetical protein